MTVNIRPAATPFQAGDAAVVNRAGDPATVVLAEVAASGAYSSLSGIPTEFAPSAHTHIIANVTGLQSALDGKQPLSAVLTGTTASFTTAQESKLSGIAAGATANATDAQLRDRATHTGAQAISTVTGLQGALDAKQATLVSGTNIKTINGTTILGAGNIEIVGGGGGGDVSISGTPTAGQFARWAGSASIEGIAASSALATTSVAGFMAAADKEKLDGFGTPTAIGTKAEPIAADSILIYDSVDGLPKTSLFSALPAGPAGADGKTILSGAGAPAGGLGADGDFYIDTTADAIYGPKTGGAWGSGTSLIGSQGDPGQGVPVGGTTGQIIAKASATDYATEWVDRWTVPVGSALATTGTVNLDMAALNGSIQTIAATGAITFTTSNRAAGRHVALKITENGTASRALTWPAGWVALGAALPAAVDDQTLWVTVVFTGTADADATVGAQVSA